MIHLTLAELEWALTAPDLCATGCRALGLALLRQIQLELASKRSPGLEEWCSGKGLDRWCEACGLRLNRKPMNPEFIRRNMLNKNTCAKTVATLDGRTFAK